MRDRWRWLPLWLGTACIAGGVVVVAVLFYGSGEQISSSTQLPYVLVAGGAGLGAILFGASVCRSQRHRLEQQQVEEAAARMLRAAALLSRSRTGALAQPVRRGGRVAAREDGGRR